MINLILIDYSWLYNKYYYVAKQRDNTNLNLTCFQMLCTFFYRIRTSYPTSKVFVVLDSSLSSTGTLSINENYKQNRDKEAKKEVYKDLREITSKLAKEISSFYFLKAHGYEADYTMASLAKKYYFKVANILVFSGDKDLLQLTYYPKIKVSNKFENGKFLELTDSDIFSKFKNSKGEDFTRISNKKIDLLKYRVLKGDKSDNLDPVIPRIKDTVIKEIILKYWDEDYLCEEVADGIIMRIKEDNEELAAKLGENKKVWLGNWQLMNLIGARNDVKVVRLKVRYLKNIKNYCIILKEENNLC